MLIYIALFIVATSMLTLFGYTGYTYLSVMILLGIIWLGLSVKGFWVTENKPWARNMFIYSIVIIAMFSVSITVGLFF